jgi:pheromone shutdown-related protein TraB
MKYKNLNIIGTSHIAKQSLEEVEKFIEEKKPDIVALELDAKRFYSLTHKPRGKARMYDIRRVGVKGFLFSVIGSWAERKLGQIVNVEPGSEMMLAIKLAKKHKLKIALIDQDIEITLRKFSKSLTFREKWNFIVDLFKGFVLKKKEVEFDLTKVPEKKVIKKLVSQVKKRYPNVYKILVEERNNIMANNLSSLMEKNQDKSILAIIGAGHEDDIVELIKKPNISYSITFG